jgi:cell division protein ZapA
MGQITVTVNGRTFKLACAEGEETRVLQLAGQVARRADAVIEEFGAMSDDRVLLLAGIMLAGELMEAHLPADVLPETTTPQDELAWAGSHKAAR